MENSYGYTHITSLGDGVYSGKMSGHVLTHKGKQYWCTDGLRGMNISVVVEVKNGIDEIIC